MKHFFCVPVIFLLLFSVLGCGTKTTKYQNLLDAQGKTFGSTYVDGVDIFKDKCDQNHLRTRLRSLGQDSVLKIIYWSDLLFNDIYIAKWTMIDKNITDIANTLKKFKWIFEWRHYGSDTTATIWATILANGEAEHLCDPVYCIFSNIRNSQGRTNEVWNSDSLRCGKSIAWYESRLRGDYVAAIGMKKRGITTDILMSPGADKLLVFKKNPDRNELPDSEIHWFDTLTADPSTGKLWIIDTEGNIESFNCDLSGKGVIR